MKRPARNATTGQRTHPVMVVSLEQVSDSAGGFALEDQPEMTAWARIRRVYGSEAMVAGALAGKQSVEVFIPASNAARQITTSMVLIDAYTGKRFNIRDVSESEDRAEVMLLCESGVPT